jgi:hypothetical protein
MNRFVNGMKNAKHKFWNLSGEFSAHGNFKIGGKSVTEKNNSIEFMAESVCVYTTTDNNICHIQWM